MDVLADTWLAQLAAALAPSGLNQLGVIGRARYDAAAPPQLAAGVLHPATRSIVVVASGGDLLWRRFLDYVAADPRERLARRPHPLDAFCAASLAATGALLDGCRVFPSDFLAPIRLDFVRLGELAGLGRPSELGILLSPRFGPWLGLRAALFTPHLLAESAPAARACDGCAAPCRAGRTFDERRGACIAAPDQRYCDAARDYHRDPAGAGRAALLARFGVADESAAQ